jgi:hypothetical protein
MTLRIRGLVKNNACVKLLGPSQGWGRRIGSCVAARQNRLNAYPTPNLDLVGTPTLVRDVAKRNKPQIAMQINNDSNDN